MSIVTLKCLACDYQVKKSLANWNDNAPCPRCNNKVTATVTMQVSVPQQQQVQQPQQQVQQMPKINADAAVRAAIAAATAQSSMRQPTVTMSTVSAQLAQLQPVQIQPQAAPATVTVTSQPPPSSQIPPVQLPLQPLPPQQTIQTHLQQLQPQPPTSQPVLDLQLKNVVQQVVTGTKSSPGGTTELKPPPEVFMSLQPVSPQQLAIASPGATTLTVQRQPLTQVTMLSPPQIQLPQHPLPVAQAIAQEPSPPTTVTTIDIQSQLQSLQPIPQAIIVNSVPAAAVATGGKGQGKQKNRHFFYIYRVIIMQKIHRQKEEEINQAQK